MKLSELIKKEKDKMIEGYPLLKNLPAKIFVDEFNFQQIKDEKVDNIVIELDKNLTQQKCIIEVDGLKRKFSTIGCI